MLPASTVRSPTTAQPVCARCTRSESSTSTSWPVSSVPSTAVLRQVFKAPPSHASTAGASERALRLSAPVPALGRITVEGCAPSHALPLHDIRPSRPWRYVASTTTQSCPPPRAASLLLHLPPRRPPPPTSSRSAVPISSIRSSVIIHILSRVGCFNMSGVSKLRSLCLISLPTHSQ